LPDGLVVDRQADSITLARDQVCERRRSDAGVVELGDAGPALERHRLAGVDEDLRDEVRRFAVLLRVEAIRAGEQLPVEYLRSSPGR
jgi:hypothetical protein